MQIGFYKKKEEIYMTLEQQAIHIITALPADKLSQVLSFARFLSEQPETDAMSAQVSVKEKGVPRQPGILKGQMRIADDFDKTPECFKEYM